MMRMTSATDPLQVLLIEDNKGDAILIERILQQALLGAVVVEKQLTLEGALTALATKDFDVALLDRSLPDAQGFSGLHSIQNFAPKVPIVFLTAYRDEETALQAIYEGAQDYLYKDQLDVHVIKRAIQYATLRKQFEGVLIMRANFDGLTGLANRTLFESRLDMALARMKRHRGNLAVLFLDLNRFKQVNDTLGHHTGDLLLQEAATRIKQSLRPYDTAARFGGDEFAILMEEMPALDHSEVVAQKIIHLLEAPFMIENHRIEIGVSIGISLCSATQMLDRETLMQQADAAMYAVKSTGTSAYFKSLIANPAPAKKAVGS